MPGKHRFPAVHKPFISATEPFAVTVICPPVKVGLELVAATAESMSCSWSLNRAA